MSKVQDVHIIRSRKEMAALKAPTRQEIIDALAPMGVVTVAQLATVLGRPASALYYHLQALMKAGLVVAGGGTPPGSRPESQYRTVAPGLRLAYDTGPKGNAKDVTPIVSSMLRITMRDFEASFKQKGLRTDGAHRQIWASRITGWFTEEQLGKVNDALSAILSNTSETPASTGDLYAFTFVLTPLVQRRLKKGPTRKAQGAPKSRPQ